MIISLVVDDAKLFYSTCVRTHPLTRQVAMFKEYLFRQNARTILMTLVVVLVACWAAVLFSVHYTARSMKTAAAQSLEAHNRIANHNLEAWFKRQSHEIRTLARHPTMVAAATTLSTLPQDAETLNNAPAQQQLREAVSLTARVMFEGYFLIDMNGISLASSRSANTGTPNFLNNEPDFMERIWAGETVFTGLVTSDVPIETASGGICETRLNMFVGTLVRDETGKGVAVLTLRINPQYSLFPITTSHGFAETGETYLVDPSGNLASPSRFDAIRALQTGCPDFGERINQPLWIPEPSGAETFIQSAQGVLDGTENTSIRPYTDYRGVEVVGVWSQIAGSDLGVITEQDYTEAFAAVHRYRRAAFLLGLGVTVALSLAAFALRQAVRNFKTNLRFGWLFHQMESGAFFLDSTGQIKSANAAFCEQLGLTPDQLIGKSISILDPKVMTIVDSIIHATPPARHEHYFMIWTRPADNDAPVYLSLSLSNLSVGKGALIGGVSIDITHAEETKRKLEKARSAAENNLTARTRLLQTVSHELRTPLNAVLGPLGLARDSENPQDARDLMNIAIEGAEQLLGIVEAIEVLVGLEASEVTPALAEFPLRPILESAVQNARTVGGPADITAQLGPDLPENIHSDPQMIADILSELFANAQTHAGQCANGTPHQIILRAKVHTNGASARTLRIEVQDNGTGIDKADADLLFAPFSRLGSVNTAETRGIGTGLAIARARASLLGGYLDYSPTPGGGATFVLMLPLIG
jgi:PAS domain S-box-containing protein